MRDLARRLLAASRSASDPHVHEAVLVSERLRQSLTRFAGADGFAALQRRALALASAEVPALLGVKIGEDGRLEGFERLPANGHARGNGPQEDVAALAMTSHLLGLLITFIGEPLTLTLVREAWPDTPLDK